MSELQATPQVEPEVVWRPDAERIEAANVTRLMRANGVDDLAALRARSLDPEWLWPAIFADLGFEFAEPPSRVLDSSDGPEWPHWFPGARLNLSSLCLDRWAESKGAAEAISWESERGEQRTLSWTELRSMSESLAGGLRDLGVGPRDTVGLFMPMAPETVAALHACAKLGAIAVPMFSGYGAGAVATRLAGAGVKVLIAADGFPRAGKEVPMKEIADEAVALAGTDTTVVVWRRLARECPRGPDDVDWDELLLRGDPVAGEPVASDHPLLLVYTSGTTGKPKGAVLSQAGLLAAIGKDAAYHLDIGAGDTVSWVTDIGWIMGPWTIIAAGSAGARLCLIEGSPTTPSPTRLWELVERESITMLGVSPSLTRGLISKGAAPSPEQVRSLRTIGATGEPMSPEAYRWLADIVGGRRCPIINISGGTEVGGAFLAPLPTQELKVSSLGGPALGMDVGIVDDEGHDVAPGEVGQLICRAPWPAMTMGLWKDPERYLDTYWRRLPGVWVHGDWASVDEDGQWFLHGRSDDTLNIAGQRIGPTEIEAALVAQGVADAAAIPVPHEIKGEELWCFVVPAEDAEPDVEALARGVAVRVGKPFKPSRIVVVASLPRTRTGKVMRRVVRAIALDQEVGDLSTIEDEGAIAAVKAGLEPADSSEDGRSG
jgi:acetyl-CoA synthetase